MKINVNLRLLFILSKNKKATKNIRIIIQSKEKHHKNRINGLNRRCNLLIDVLIIREWYFLCF
jgi:hypothetical protein